MDEILLYNVRNQAQKIKGIMDSYERAADGLYEECINRSIGAGFTKLITGVNPYADNPMHEAHFRTLQEAVDEFAGYLPELGAEDRQAAADAAWEVCEILLKDTEKDYLRFMFMADDQLCGPMLDYISDGNMQKMYDRFCADPELYRGVPTQEQLLKKLEDKLTQRGLPVKKRTFWQKLKDRLSF